jgi:hypothetical protein
LRIGKDQRIRPALGRLGAWITRPCTGPAATWSIWRLAGHAAAVLALGGPVAPLTSCSGAAPRSRSTTRDPKPSAAKAAVILSANRVSMWLRTHRLGAENVAVRASTASRESPPNHDVRTSGPSVARSRSQARLQASAAAGGRSGLARALPELLGTLGPV